MSGRRRLRHRLSLRLCFPLGLVLMLGCSVSFWLVGAQQQFTDSNGMFNFDADLKSTSSDVMSNIGTAVTLWSDYAAVSASHSIANYNSYHTYGIVFLFKNYPSASTSSSSWVDTGLTFSSGIAADKYGACMAMAINLLVVGAPADQQHGTGAGAAYVHFGTDYQTTVTLLPDEGEDYSYFGSSVAVTLVKGESNAGNTLILVGAYGHGSGDGDHGHANSGMVYVFYQSYSTYEGFLWPLATKMRPSESAANSFFGMSVAASDSIVAIGAPGSDKVFVYTIEHHPKQEAREDEEREREEREREEREREEREHEPHRRYVRRSLQEHEKEGEERHEEEREREEKERQEDKKEESEWGYWELLVISASQGYNEDRQGYPFLNFGCSVAMHNTSVPSIAIGASSDGLVSATGGAYVVSMPHKNHLFGSWRPDRRRVQSNEHERKSEDNQQRSLQEHERERGEEEQRQQEEREEREKEEKEKEEERVEPGKEWNLFSTQYVSDSIDNYWILEYAVFGTRPDERFGSMVSLSSGVMAVSGGGGSTYPGKIQIYSRVPYQGAGGNTYSNIILRGPLYNTEWRMTSSIYDVSASGGDKFGSVVKISSSTLVVGSPSLSSGVGGAYLYIAHSNGISRNSSSAEDNVSNNNDNASNNSDSNGGSTESNGNALQTDSDEDSGQQFSFFPIVGAILICAIVVRIRYCFIKKKKKKKHKKMSSLSDIDSSINSTSPMMDTSVDSSVSSVQMASSAKRYAQQQQQISPQPSSFGSQDVPANVYGGTSYAGGGRSNSQINQPSRQPQSLRRSQQQQQPQQPNLTHHEARPPSQHTSSRNALPYNNRRNVVPMK